MLRQLKVWLDCDHVAFDGHEKLHFQLWLALEGDMMEDRLS